MVQFKTTYSDSRQYGVSATGNMFGAVPLKNVSHNNRINKITDYYK